ncbi:unnamed protein product [Rotaria sordida]|uniref:Uncharacterized protein n=1 Tax=Rotaria sordida TaxID=392033 RepID=A0A819E8V7_9BILA|nr:unnamed protein product [Rotaria sordida]CAF1508636.1 unnamed protein product [Rotaria sordida]CAF3846656.1 unnamed protein product [Rotaria sordida]CAF4000258.1 unnamed protein product [Rotaria sordida]
MEIVPFYNGDPETLSDWLRDTGAFFAKECVPDAHQVFAIRFLLTEQALDIYSAHEDLIQNFNDLRKLLLHTAGKAPLRLLASLDSISTLTLSMPPPVANSTCLDPNLTTTTSLPTTSITFNQSADQDIRSFCSVIRNLCKEYDPDMSKKMKLDFLLRAVNPTYRPEILKLKPTDPDEFEQIALDVENTFLTLKAYETNTPSTLTIHTSSPQYGSNYPATQQSSASNYYYHRTQNNFRPTQRPFSNTTSRQFMSSPKHHQGSQQSSYYNPPKSPRQQNLFAYTSPTSETQVPQQSIPPLMPPSQIKTPPQQLFSSQWCNQQGHSTHDGPF